MQTEKQDHRESYLRKLSIISFRKFYWIYGLAWTSISKKAGFRTEPYFSTMIRKLQNSFNWICEQTANLARNILFFPTQSLIEFHSANSNLNIFNKNYMTTFPCSGRCIDLYLQNSKPNPFASLPIATRIFAQPNANILLDRYHSMYTICTYLKTDP